MFLDITNFMTWKKRWFKENVDVLLLLVVLLSCKMFFFFKGEQSTLSLVYLYTALLRYIIYVYSCFCSAKAVNVKLMQACQGWRPRAEYVVGAMFILQRGPSWHEQLSGKCDMLIHDFVTAYKNIQCEAELKWHMTYSSWRVKRSIIIFVTTN